MAFNFNWSPLMADTSRARDMLTTALNKSPKPPIIVDDIIVTELNLGSTPPELEILEVGDLAEDRFRGIFKMSYTGDAFLTLKTKVQANPLNTYLSTKPDFASPQPLAAASSLTIPLQITLSEIRLSGFVILVFSKQKGITLVFRNDPLESLKVSSTFDSIPFVRDYLQKEIEGQLRVLFMEDLPAIIHRLSLRLWSSDYEDLETEQRLDTASKNDTVPIDPLSTPPQDAVDAFGNVLDASQISALSLDDNVHNSFSQKNIKRLAALSESQHTLSLFTPEMREVVYRAWAGQSDRAESGANTPSLTRSSLSRIQSTFGTAKSAGSSVMSDSTGNETLNSRPSLVSNNSNLAGLSLGSGRGRANQMRNRKKRVVDLRKSGDGAESSNVSSAVNTPMTSTNVSETASVIPEECEEELTTPPRSPPKASRSDKTANSDGLLAAPPLGSSPKLSKSKSKQSSSKDAPSTPVREQDVHSSSRPPLSNNKLRPARQMTSPIVRSLSFDKVSTLSSKDRKSPKGKGAEEAESSGGILEQAWMLKMAQEIAKKVHEHKAREAEMDAPPAYVA
jgi:distribution and morphology protein 34